VNWLKAVQTVTLFSSKNTVDIGSSTYNYSDLAPVSDYSKSLEETKSGKITVDKLMAEFLVTTYTY
jgi:hypothetical protein